MSFELEVLSLVCVLKLSLASRPGTAGSFDSCFLGVARLWTVCIRDSALPSLVSKSAEYPLPATCSQLEAQTQLHRDSKPFLIELMEHVGEFCMALSTPTWRSL